MSELEMSAPVAPKRRGRKPKVEAESKAALQVETDVKPEAEKAAPLIVITKKDPWEKWEDEKREDFRMVKGIFKNYENPGQPIKFCTRKYKGEPVRWWPLRDGEIAELPLYVAKRLNTDCWFPIHEHAIDPQTNRPLPIIGLKKHRTGFQGLEFHDPSKHPSRHSS